MLNYTLGFIKYKNEILLLNRENPGWMGCFNGLGGKIEVGETPFESIRREIKEEANIEVEKVKLCGFVTWKKFEKDSGAYIFLIEVDSKPFEGPIAFDEGILAWKDISWITHPENKGIARNVLPFIERFIKTEKQIHFKTDWHGNKFNGVDLIETDLDVVYSTEFVVTEFDYKTLAITKLEKEFYKNVNAIYFLKNDLYKELKIVGNSIVLKLLNDGVFIYWDRKTSFKYIEDHLRKTDYKFYMINDDVINQLQRTRARKYLSTSTQYYLEEIASDSFDYQVEAIREESVDFILKNMHYKLGYSKELLLNRIRNGFTSAIYQEEQLVAWVYQHDDGSVGGLNVLEYYRRKGLAKAVCIDIVNKIVEVNGFAICQIENNNTSSINLFKSLGFKESHQINWIGFEK